MRFSSSSSSSRKKWTPNMKRRKCVNIVILCGVVVALLAIRNIYFSMIPSWPQEHSNIIHKMKMMKNSRNLNVNQTHKDMQQQQRRRATTIYQRHGRLQAMLSKEPMGSSMLFVVCDDSDNNTQLDVEAYRMYHSYSWAHIYTPFCCFSSSYSSPPSTLYVYILLGQVLGFDVTESPNRTISSYHNITQQFRWIGTMDFEQFYYGQTHHDSIYGTHHDDDDESNQTLENIIIDQTLLLESSFGHTDDSITINPKNIQQQLVVTFSSITTITNMKHFFSQIDISYPGLTSLFKHVLGMIHESSDLMDLVMTSTITSKTNNDFIYFHPHEFVTHPYMIQSFIPWLSKILFVLYFDIHVHQIVIQEQEKKKKKIMMMNSSSLYTFTSSSIFILYPMLESLFISYFFNTRGAYIMTMNDYHRYHPQHPLNMSTPPFTTTMDTMKPFLPPRFKGYTIMTPSGKAFEERINRGRENYYNRRNPDPTPFIFISCQDKKSCSTATQVYSSYSWACMYELSTSNTLLQEYSFFTNHLDNLLHLANFNTRWIGLLPWKGTLQFNLSSIDSLLQDPILINDGVDVLLISTTINLSEEPSDSNLMDILECILLSTGETKDSISSHWNRHSMTNDFYFMTTIHLMRSFIPWFSRTLILTQTDPMCYQDIQDWPFLAKQLATYFFMTRGHKIISMSDYEKILVERKRIKDEQEFYSTHNSKMIQGLHTEADGVPLVFVLCHNQHSFHEANNFYSNFTWAHIYILHTTFMMETYFYTNILESIMDATNHTTPWVGSISYRAKGKTYLSTIHEMLSDHSLIDDGYDLLAFWTPLHRGDSIHSQTDWFHPGLMELIDYTLLSLGESQENVTRMSLAAPKFNAFFGSFFVCRPVLMRRYISWLNRVVIFVNTDPKAQRMLWKNSHYFGTEGVSETVYGKSYYPLHPFLGERISSYFFNTRGAKIALVDSSTGKYPWYKDER